MEFSNIIASLFQTGLDIFSHILQSGFSHLIPAVEAGSPAGVTTAISVLPLLKTALIFLAGFALVFGVALALIARYFHTKSDPKVEAIEDLLAHAHCGACGFAGCHQYAVAVVNDPNIAPNLCTPAGKSASLKIALLSGKQIGEQEARIAFVTCRGDDKMAKKKFDHHGVHGCVAVSVVGGGHKECSYGCLGYGTCVATCPFNAIVLNSDSLPEVDSKKCVACGLCVKACPRKIIAIVPKNSKPVVKCCSQQKGATVKKSCKAGCISCSICIKNCPSEAITMTNNVVKIDPKKCTNCGICETKCPTKAIQRLTV